jgi:predicted nucleic acid-binding protein
MQVLNEFVSVARRKFRIPWNDVKVALQWIQVLCPDTIPITKDIHTEAVGIAQRYGFGIYDALIAAAALQAKCEVLYSEDFQDGQAIDGRLTVRNPFISVSERL